MLERFTAGARQAVTDAREEVLALGHRAVGAEHLLLAVLRHPQDPAVAVLVDAGLDHPTARAAVVRLLGGSVDGDALASIGVDLDAVREAVEAAFGEGALDAPPREERRGRLRGTARGMFTDRARKVLELAVREAQRMKAPRIDLGHLLLGLIREADGLAGRVIVDHGLDLAAVHRKVEVTLD